MGSGRPRKSLCVWGATLLFASLADSLSEPRRGDGSLLGVDGTQPGYLMWGCRDMPPKRTVLSWAFSVLPLSFFPLWLEDGQADRCLCGSYRVLGVPHAGHLGGRFVMIFLIAFAHFFF